MIKLSDRWNNNWPDCFKSGNWIQLKGRILEDIRNLEKQIEDKDKELYSLKEKVSKSENYNINRNIINEKIEIENFDKLPLVYQVETLVHVNWYGSSGIVNLYNYQTLEESLKNQALRIWNDQDYDEDEILKQLTQENSRSSTVVTLLDRLLLYKRTLSFGSEMDNHYRWNSINTMNSIYQNQLNLNQNKEKLTKILSEKVEILSSELLEIKKNEFEQLIKNYKDKLDENSNIFLEIFLQENSKIAKRQLLKKFDEKALEELSSKKNEINKLESQLNILEIDQLTESFIELPPYIVN